MLNAIEKMKKERPVQCLDWLFCRYTQYTHEKPDTIIISESMEKLLVDSNNKCVPISTWILNDLKSATYKGVPISVVKDRHNNDLLCVVGIDNLFDFNEALTKEYKEDE